MRAGAVLDQKGRVVDAVMLLQFLAGVVQHIVVMRGARAHEMRRQRGFSRAHAPDIQIVNFIQGCRESHVFRLPNVDALTPGLSAGPI